MIRDAQQAVTTCRSGLRHLLHRRSAITPSCVGMEFAVDVREGHQCRDLFEALKFVAAVSQLGGNERKSVARVDVLLGRGLVRDGSQAFEMPRISGRPKQRRSPSSGGSEVDICSLTVREN